jgi:type VI secretion system protein
MKPPGSPPVDLSAARGLLGRLSGRRPPSTPDAVLAHLHALLSTRMGESLSAPRLGLVDFADIVHGYPSSMLVLVRAIRAMLAQFEPRLREINVRPTSTDDPLTLALEISARIDDGRGNTVHMRTELTASGRVQVSGG